MSGQRPGDRVSIVIRSSARPELGDALQSAIDQTHRNVDVVIVNVTGRTHPPLPPVRQQADALTVRLVDPGRPLPRAQAANAGLDAATGDHVLFLDDDDLLDPDHVAALVAAVREDPQRLPFTGSQIADERGAVQAVWPALAFGTLEIAERIRMQLSAALIPRRLIDDASDPARFDPGLPIFEDWDLWIRLSRRIAFRPLPVNTAIGRVGIGTSGTGMGANFDLERTARDSQPFHDKWEADRIALAARLDALRDAADAALAAGDLETAESLCWEAQSLKVWDPRTLNGLSRIFAARNQPAHARRFAGAAGRARLLAPQPMTRDALARLHAHLDAGNKAALAGDNTTAEAQFRAALALHEGDQTACNGLANLAIAGGRPAEAEEWLRQGSLWGDRVYPSMLLKRGTLLEQMGRSAEAKTLYAHLARLLPRDARARERLQALEIIAAIA